MIDRINFTKFTKCGVDCKVNNDDLYIYPSEKYKINNNKYSNRL